MRNLVCLVIFGIAAGTSSSGPLRDRLREKRAGHGRADDSFRAGGTEVVVWRARGAGEKTAPLVIFSHGFHGSPEQSRFLMVALAEHGYWVMAPRHADALGSGEMSLRPETGFGNPDAWSDDDFRDRAEDVKRILHAVRSDPSWMGRIDRDRIALAGHSLGGYTVLGVAGARPGWKAPGIRAVLALSPYVNPYVRKATLQDLEVPVMYQTGTLDLGVAPFVARDGTAFDLTRPPVSRVVLSRAGHLAWTDANPRFHESIVEFSLAFLERYLEDPSHARSWPQPRDLARFDER